MGKFLNLLDKTQEYFPQVLKQVSNLSCFTLSNQAELDILNLVSSTSLVLWHKMNGRHSSPASQRLPNRGSKNSRPEPSHEEEIVPLIFEQCFLCGEACQQLCQWCRLVYCCSSSHFRIHRNKSKCGPYLVVGSYQQEDVRGRQVYLLGLFHELRHASVG